MSFADPLLDPLSDAAFSRALIDVLVVAVVAGVVGSFIVLRGTGFLGDALAHAIFPGIVIAFLMDISLLAGALVAGLATAGLMGALTASDRVRVDAAIGVIFTGAFALGVILITGESIGEEELEGILFGDPLAAQWSDVLATLLIGAAVVAAVFVLRRLFVMAFFDPTGARAMGLSVVGLDVLFLLLTALTVVISFKAVGNILVISLLITPAATARLLTDRLARMTLIASAIGAIAGVVGIYIGYHTETSAGGVIVLVATAAFFVVWLAAPRHGILSMAIMRGGALLHEPPEAEAEIILASPQISAPHETSRSSTKA